MGGPGCEERAPPFAPTAKGGGWKAFLSLSLFLPKKNNSKQMILLYLKGNSLSLSLSFFLCSLSLETIFPRKEMTTKKEAREGGKREKERRRKKRRRDLNNIRWKKSSETEKNRICGIVSKKGFWAASRLSPHHYSRTRSLASSAANAPQLSNIRSPILRKVSCESDEALSTRAEAAASSYLCSAFSPASGTPVLLLLLLLALPLLPATEAAATTWSNKA